MTANRPSLLRSLARDMVAAHVIGVVVMVLLVVQVLQSTVDALEIRDMREVAGDIVARVSTDAAGRPTLRLPPELAARFSPSYGRYVYAVLDAKGRGAISSLGDGEPIIPFTLPASADDGQTFHVRHGDALLMGVTVRSADLAKPVWVQVAENMNHRDVLMDDVVGAFLIRAVWGLVPLFLVLVAVALVRMKLRLRPLLKASDLASRIGPDAIDVRLPEDAMPAEIVPLVSAVNSALNRLDHAFQAQKEFLENAAHELRTPLAVLRARVDTLGDSGARRQLGDDIAIIARTVTQLLRVAELEGLSPPANESVDLAALARAIATYLGPVAQAQGKSFLVSGAEHLPVAGNAEALGQAINNLVENALSHTAPETRVEILLSARPQPTIQIRDHGPGVPPNERELIFQRFWRRDRRRGTGAGLGLSIVARAVDIHHGRIAVGDAPGGGAVFTITLPPAKTDGTPPKPIF